MSHASEAHRQEPGPGKGAVKDPVCGMQVDRARAEEQTELRGQRYYFCSAHCREKFKQDPGRYLRKSAE